MIKWIKDLRDEMLDLEHDYMTTKNELDGLIALKIEDIFDDLLCINSYVWGEQVYFEIDEPNRKITDEQIKQVEKETCSENWEKYIFILGGLDG